MLNISMLCVLFGTIIIVSLNKDFNFEGQFL